MDAVDRLKEDEGFRSHPYKCPAGYLTIGYGRNIDTTGNGLSEIEASFMLRNDVVACEIDLRGTFADWATFGPIRQGALINMRFQLGSRGFHRFRYMIKAIKLGAWGLAASHALDSLWALQTPRRALRVSEEIRTGISL